jgi:diacylglycerol kinase
MIKRYLRRLPHAFAGIFYALGNDFGFRSQCYAGAVLSIVLLYFLHPISTTEFIFLGISAMFVLITELQNSALEYALDHLHPEKHESIKRSKDMAAGAVLLAGLFAFLVIVILCADRAFR